VILSFVIVTVMQFGSQVQVDLVFLQLVWLTFILTDWYVVPPLPFLFLHGGEVGENESEQREKPRQGAKGKHSHDVVYQ
jgi:hypothetical protein